MDMITVLSVSFCLVVIVSLFELIRRNRLKERYSLLWLFSFLVMLVFSCSKKLLYYVSALLDIKYPPSLIFFIGFLFLVIINIHFSTVISELSDKNKTLAQEVALLKEIMGKGKKPSD